MSPSLGLDLVSPPTAFAQLLVGFMWSWKPWPETLAETAANLKPCRQHAADHESHSQSQSDTESNDGFVAPQEADRRLDAVVLDMKHAHSRSGALQQHLDNLQQDVDKAKQDVEEAQTAIKKTWRSVIFAFCRHPNTNNFPKWALDTLGQELVLVCLRAEFAAEELGNFWRERGPQKCREFAAYLGLANPDMLALFFGADVTRSPSSKSLRKIFSSCHPDSGSGNTFIGQSYPMILGNWAKRLGYNTNRPVDRRRCILAYLPADTPKAKVKRLRITPKDFNFLLRSISDNDGDRETVADSSEDEEDHENMMLVHSEAPPSQQDSLSLELHRSKEVDHTTPATTHATAISSVSSAISTTSAVSVTSTVSAASTAPTTPPTASSASSVSRPFLPRINESCSPPPLEDSSSMCQSFDGCSSPSTVSPTRAVAKRRADASFELPSTKRLKTASTGVPPHPTSADAGRPQAELEVLSLSPEMMGRGRAFEVADHGADPEADPEAGQGAAEGVMPIDDNTAEPPVSQAPDQDGHGYIDHQVADYNVLQQEQQRQLVAQTIITLDDNSPGTELQATVPTSGPFLNIGNEGLGQLAAGLDAKDTVKGNETLGWINDNIMHELCKLAALSAPNFTTISGLLPFGERSPTHPTIIQAMLDPHMGQHIDNVVICANPSENHWVAIRFNIPERTIVVLDSLPPSPVRRKHVADVIGRVMALMPQDMRDSPPSPTYPECARQKDGCNCGIFVLAYLWYSITDLPIPADLDGSLWRRLFLAMATQCSILETLPDEVRGVVSKVPLPRPGLVNPESEPEPDLDPSAEVDALVRKAKCVAEASRAVYTNRAKEARRVLEWVASEVAPLLARLTASATREDLRLHTYLSQVDGEVALCERAAQRLLSSPSAMSRACGLAQEDVIRRLKRARDAQRMRQR